MTAHEDSPAALPELRPCPFCDSADLLLGRQSALLYPPEFCGIRVECEDCGARGPWFGRLERAQLVEHWNKAPRAEDVQRLQRTVDAWELHAADSADDYPDDEDCPR